jgi:hypothetical protein
MDGLMPRTYERTRKCEGRSYGVEMNDGNSAEGQVRRTASCCCGNAEIVVLGRPEINALCHCRNCKKRTGSAFGWSAYFREDQVLQRPDGLLVYRLATPCRQERFFCPNCGTTLFWVTDDYRGYIGIAGGCFVEQPLPEPGLSVAGESKSAWLRLPDTWRTSF